MEENFPTHIAIYHTSNGKSATYEFYAGKKENFHLLKKKPLAIKRAPAFLEREMKERILEKGGRYEPVRLGFMRYVLGRENFGRRCRTAILDKTFPKSELGRNNLKGAGYYLAAITTNHLRRKGIKKMRSSERISESGKRHLENVNLPLMEFIPIGIWLKGMGRGIKAASIRKKD